MTEQSKQGVTALVGTLILAALLVATAVWSQAAIERERARERATAKPAGVTLVGARVAEDDRRWNCATMGNLRCGRGQSHPRTGERLVRGQYEPVPRGWYGLRVERANGSRGWVTLRKGCTRHVRGGTPLVCKGGVGTF